jgi:cell wall-associated NlpC family hydrolase
MIFRISLSNFKEYVRGVQDCWTLLQDIYAENGIELPDYVSVNSASKRNAFKEFLVDNLNIEKVDKLERGALILFETDPWHCGVAVDDKSMIHRASGINTRIEEVKRYGKEVAGIYLVKKIDSR